MYSERDWPQGYEQLSLVSIVWHCDVWLSAVHVVYLVYTGTVTWLSICMCDLLAVIVSSPDPTLKEGKGSGDFGLNPRFLRYRAR